VTENRLRATCAHRQHLRVTASAVPFVSIINRYRRVCTQCIGCTRAALAAILDGRHRYDESKRCYFDALKIYRREYGASHPEIAVVLNNLGALYHATGGPNIAGSYYRAALRMKRRELGASHPDMGVPMNNLAMLYRQQGRCELAESWFKKALRILDSSLGSSHPATRELGNNQRQQHQRRALVVNAGRVREGEAPGNVLVNNASVE